MGITLKEIFTTDAVSRLARRPSPSDSLRFRLEALDACGPLPLDTALACRVQELRAWRAAWEAYTFTAKVCGLFDGTDGRDLLSRLTGHDDEGFRSAMAECMVCWYFAGHRKLPVDPWPTGRNGRKLDLLVTTSEGEMFVEVKAPKRERPEEGSWGLADDLFAGRLDESNRKFIEGKLNLLVLAPEVRPTVHELPVQLVQALYGQEMILCPIDPRTGDSLGPSRTGFKPDGKLLATRRRRDDDCGSASIPALTRVGAVVSIEERLVSRFPMPDPDSCMDKRRRDEIEMQVERHFSPANTFFATHDVAVFHNPNAAQPIPVDLWGDARQFSVTVSPVRPEE